MPSLRLLAPALFALAMFGAAAPASAAQLLRCPAHGHRDDHQELSRHPSRGARGSDGRAHQAPGRGRGAEARGQRRAEFRCDLQLAAPGRARQQGRRRHLRRVLRLQLRLLQARDGRHADPHEGRSEAEGRAEGISGAEPGLGRSRPGRGRRAHAGSHRQEIPRLPPEAARRPRRRPTRRARWRRPRKPASTSPRSRRTSAAPRCAPRSRRTSSLPKRWA